MKDEQQPWMKVTESDIHLPPEAADSLFEVLGLPLKEMDIDWIGKDVNEQ